MSEFPCKRTTFQCLVLLLLLVLVLNVCAVLSDSHETLVYETETAAATGSAVANGNELLVVFHLLDQETTVESGSGSGSGEQVDTGELMMVQKEDRRETDLLDQRTLIKLHGAFMVFAWMGTTTIGVLIARYFKRTWINRQLFGTQAWFFWHRTCMMFTWSLTLTAFIMIFIDVDGWSNEELPHAVLGTITTLICFLHPIFATFRPTLNSPKRKYFNMGHAFGGGVAQILSLVTIFLAVNMPKAELPPWLFFVLAAFVVSLIGVHAFFTYLAYKAENHPQYGNRDYDAPYSTYRKYGLIGAGIMFTALVVTIITVIILAPLPSSTSTATTTADGGVDADVELVWGIFSDKKHY